MYVTLDNTLPTISNYAYSSTVFSGFDSILVVAGQGPAGVQCSAAGGTCTVTIGILCGLFSSEYILMISLGQGAPNPLINGVPRADWLILKGTYNFYSLASTFSSFPRFTFSITPISGDPDIFVGSSKRGPNQMYPRASDPSSYCWMGTGVRDAIEVQPSDPCYCKGPPDCIYYISVFAGGATGTQYSILAVEDQGGEYSLLMDGVPDSGILSEGETSYYTYTFPPQVPPMSPRSAEIVVTPTSGDPDLYVGFYPRRPGPGGGSNNSYTSAASSGPEDVTVSDSDIPWRSLGACSDPTLPCTLSLAVFGYSACTFQVVVFSSASGGRPEILSPGVTSQGSVSAGAFKYYSFTPSGVSNELVTISLQPFMGDADLYVGTTADVATRRPTDAMGTYTWSSTGVGTEVISIESSDPFSCVTAAGNASQAGGATCAYIIGVTGFMGNATFSLVARTRDGTPVRLSPGLPVEDVLQGGFYSRYTAEVNWALGYLEVTVAAESGDPDLYISLGESKLPTNVVYDFSSTSAGGDEDIVISVNDTKLLKACPNRTALCVANIAVYAFGSTPGPSSTASYSITASNGLRVLLDGYTTV